VGCGFRFLLRKKSKSSTHPTTGGLGQSCGQNDDKKQQTIKTFFHFSSPL